MFRAAVGWICSVSAKSSCMFQTLRRSQKELRPVEVLEVTGIRLCAPPSSSDAIDKGCSTAASFTSLL